MNGQGLILITRPAEDAQEYARELQNLGHKTFIEPMLEIVPANFSLPDLAGYRGLIFTSANAVRIFSESSSERGIEVYCVGQNTYEQARKSGYGNIYNANGSAVQIVPLILNRVGTDTGQFLHIRGEDVARPVDEMFAGSGVKVETLVVYKAEKVKALSNLCIKKLRDGEISAVTFFSKRTAESFLFQIGANDLGGALMSIKALCISQAVLECVRTRKWGDTYAASQPDRQGMLNLITQVCGSGE
ncbi:MAG TPA: hypothetical protein DEA55_09790 [Rhodospirillaceae bacterium]|nr:hypothetical protein [Rhodospirillaceae bacterium]